MMIYLPYLVAFIFMLSFVVPIVIYFSTRAVDQEARVKAEELKYEYDPKNWDTLNK
jgi:protein-S-isoprenylcysteine O-methyltransferase Ste14